MDAELKKLIEKAEAGNVKAAAWAGDCFNKGIFTGKNNVEAHKYYLMAAQGGHAEATFMVGLGLMFGTGADKNIPEGLKYIQKAADDNVAEYPQYISFNRVEKSEAKNDENTKSGSTAKNTSKEVDNAEARNKDLALLIPFAIVVLLIVITLFFN